MWHSSMMAAPLPELACLCRRQVAWESVRPVLTVEVEREKVLEHVSFPPGRPAT